MLGFSVGAADADAEQAQYLGVAQLVARYLGVVEAASSSLVTQTKKEIRKNLLFLFNAA